MLDECGRPVHPPIDIEKIQPSPRALRLRKGSTLDSSRQQNLHATRSPVVLSRERNTSIFFPTHPFLTLIALEEDGKNCAGARCYRPPFFGLSIAGSCGSVVGEKKLADLSTRLSRTWRRGFDLEVVQDVPVNGGTVYTGRGDLLATEFSCLHANMWAYTDITSVLTRRVA